MVIPGQGVRISVSRMLPKAHVGVTTGDEPAPLLPALTAFFSDNSGNLVSEAAAFGSALVMLCFDGTDPAPTPPGLCHCQDSRCLTGSYNDSFTRSQTSLSGNITQPFVGGVASFGDLFTQVARLDLRAIVKQHFDGVLSNLNATSGVFTVSSGRLDSLALSHSPSSDRGCKRCPIGTYIAGENLNASLIMYDVFKNAIKTCDPSSGDFCRRFLSARVIAKLFLDDMPSQQRFVAESSGGRTEVFASQGIATFENIRIKTAGNNYMLKFQAEGISFPPGLFERAISVSSGAISVVSAAPTRISSRSSAIVAADGSRFIRQPEIDIVDRFGNLAQSDCYTNCSGATPTCLFDQARCGADAPMKVSLITQSSSPGSPMFYGTKEVVPVDGTARFADLSVEAFPLKAGLCACTADPAGCTSCCPTCSVCGYSGTTVQHTLQFELTGLPKLPLSLVLARRVQKILIRKPHPTIGVANEKIDAPFVIEARDCANQLVIDSTATVTVSLYDNPSNAVLRGTVEVPLRNGTAVFDYLIVSLSGSGYTFEFTYKSSGPETLTIRSQISGGVDIDKAVTQLALSKSPENSEVEAGVKFLNQPHVLLRDEDGQLAVNSYAQVTASIANDPGADIRHNPGTTQLLGTVIVTAEKGVARFVDLKIQKASLGQGTDSTGFTLRFSHLSASTSSGKFHVKPSAWMDLLIPSFAPYSYQPVTSKAGAPLVRQPQVYLVDAYHNRVLPGQVPAGTLVNVTVEHGVGSLLAHGCNEVCTGERVKSCTTCKIAALDAGAAVVKFTNLRLDAAGTYVLRFECAGLNVVTGDFQIDHAAPAMLLSTAIPASTRADAPLAQQPSATLVDLYGNRVIDHSVYARPIVRARLLTRTGVFAKPPPLPPVLGQVPNSVCREPQRRLDGNLEANISAGYAVFTDLAVRQVYTGYRIELSVALTAGTLAVNSSDLAVTPGPPSGICNMSLLGDCAAKAPCLEHAEIVCVDAFGNVARTCTLCKTLMGQNCDLDLIHPSLSARCPVGSVCAEVAEGPTSMLLTGGGDCMDARGLRVPCAALGSGAVGALFENVTLSTASTRPRLRFFTLLQHPVNFSDVVEFSYVTPPFNVTPPGPLIVSATFSPELHKLFLSFDKITNRNADRDECESNLHPTFLARAGNNPRCSWIDKRTLELTLGEKATVDLSTRVLLAPNSHITFTSVFDGSTMTSKPATTVKGTVVDGSVTGDFFPAFGGPLPVPVVVMTGPRNLSACQRISIDASLSEGHAGKPFSQIGWSLDFAASYAESGILAPKDDPKFLNRFIHFSSLLASEVANTTLRLRPNTPVPPKSFITISGLPGFESKYEDCPQGVESSPAMVQCLFDEARMDCINVLLEGPSAGLFTRGDTTYGAGTSDVPVGQWSKNAAGESILVLRVTRSAYLPPDEDTLIWFELRNPRYPTSLRIPKISVTCVLCTCMGGLACTLGDEFNPRNVFDFTSSEQPLLIGMDCGVQCDSHVAFGQGDFDVRTRFASIKETSKVNSAINNITLTFEAEVDMPSGSAVVLDGFTPVAGAAAWAGAICLSGQDAGIFDCHSCGATTPGGVPARHGYMHETTGRLIMTVRNGTLVSAGQRYHVSFELRNPPMVSRDICVALDRQDCPSTQKPILTLLSPLRAQTLALDAPEIVGDTLISGNVLGAGVPASFSRASVRQSSDVGGLPTLLLLEFVSNQILPDETVLTIKWNGSEPAPSGAHSFLQPLHTSKPDCFEWNGATNRAMITTHGSTGERLLQTKVSANFGCRIEASETVKIAFVRKNSEVEAPPSVLIIQARREACNSCLETCDCRKRNLPAPIVLPPTAMAGRVLHAVSILGFTTLSVSESNNVPGQLNRLTVTARSSIPLLPDTNVTIRSLGLVSASGTSAGLQLIIALDGVQTERVGYIDSARGEIEFSVGVEVPEKEQFSFSWTVRNPATSLPANTRTDVNVTLQALSDVCTKESSVICDEMGLDGVYNFTATFPWRTATTAGGAVLLARGMRQLVTKQLFESTKAAQAYNIYTVKLRANFEIVGGTTFHFDSITREEDYFNEVPTASLTLRPQFKDLLPNCTCSPCECPDGCTNINKCGCYPELVNSLKKTLFFWQPDIDSSGTSYLGTPKADLTDLSSPADFEASFDPILGELTVATTPSRNIPADTDFVFSFSSYLLRNPDAEQTVPEKFPNITVRHGGTNILSSQRMDSGILGGKERAAFSRFIIEETSSVVGAFSRISVEFETNFPVVSLQGDGARIVIEGLLEYQTQTGKVPLEGLNVYDLSRYGFGNWSSTTGLMTFSGAVTFGSCGTVGNDRCALKIGTRDFSSVYKVAFFLKNTYKNGAGGNFPRIYVSTEEVRTPLYQTPSEPIGRGTSLAFFTLGKIAEMTSVQKTVNVLTVTFTPNVRLNPGSQVTIRGISGTSGDVPLNLAGPNASSFVDPTRDGGNVIVTVAANVLVQAGAEVAISFSVGNPSARQPAKAITLTGSLAPPVVIGVCPSSNLISSYGLTEPISASPVSGSVLSGAQELIFTTKTIHESTKVNSAVNTLTISLVPRSTIPTGGTITIWPLSTPLTTVNDLPLTGPSANKFGNNGFLRTEGQERLLVLTVRDSVGLTAGDAVVISLLLKNPTCSGACIAAPTKVKANGNANAPDLNFDVQEMDGRVLGGGVRLAWTKKSVKQSTLVRGAKNKITFTFRPNAPLYPGTEIRFTGLTRTITRTCVRCVDPEIYDVFDMIPSLICGKECCSPEPTPEDEDIVYFPCTPAFDENMQQPHPKFASLTRFLYDTGLYAVTVGAGQIISEKEDTVLNIILENEQSLGETEFEDKLLALRAECSSLHSAADIAAGRCMTIRTGATKLCDSDSTKGDQCPQSGGGSVQPITYFRGPADQYGNALKDLCSVCLRQVDLVAFDQSLEAQKDLNVQNMAVDSPSLRGLPTFISGGVVPGVYFILLRLTNWIQQTDTGSILLTKNTPPAELGMGALKNEYVKPVVSIEGPENRVITSDQELLLSAVSGPIDCMPVSSSRLTYRWLIRCLSGFCKTEENKDEPVAYWNKKLDSWVGSSNTPSLLLPKDKLSAGSTYQLFSTVTQNFMSSQASVTVYILPRTPVVRIFGVGERGQLSISPQYSSTASLCKGCLSGLQSSDPETRVSKSAADVNTFGFQWTCQQLEEVCSLPEGLCPLEAFVPCDPYVIPKLPANAPVSEVPYNQRSSVALNTSALRDGWTYIISLNITRDEDELKKAFADDPSDTFMVSQTVVHPDWLRSAVGTVRFTTTSSASPRIQISRCDARMLGQAGVCATPVASNIVSSRESIVLKATAESIVPSGSIASYEWSASSEAGASLLDAMIMNSRSTDFIVIKAGSFPQGHTISLGMRCTDSAANVGSASIELVFNTPPSGGSLEVSPTTGSALETQFDFYTYGWTAPADSLPLSFEFFVETSSATVAIANGQQQRAQAFLQSGPAESAYAVLVGVKVFDVIQDHARVERKVTVRPPPAATPDEFIQGLTTFETQVKADIDLGRLTAAQAGVGALAGTLNMAGTVCVPPYPLVCTADTECCARRNMRARLLESLKNVNALMIPSAAKVVTQAAVLSVVTQKTEELTFDLVKGAALFMRTAMQGARSLPIDGPTLAELFSDVADRLFIAGGMATADVLRDASAHGVPGAADGAELRSGSNSPPSHARGLKAVLTADRARELQADLLDMVAEISATSVKQAEFGLKSAVVRSPRGTFVVNTTRVKIDPATFTGFDALATDYGVEVKLPPTIFDVDSIDGAPISVELGIEVMMAVYRYEAQVLPGARGPVVAFEVRRFGGAPVVFLPFEPPVSMKLPYANGTKSPALFDETVHPTLGNRQTPFGKYFDRATWTWRTDGMMRQGTVQPRDGLRVTTTHFTEFALGMVVESCEGPSEGDGTFQNREPLSLRVKDACGVCGGTNASCSGCDGIPNTGRDKQCNGHGSCNLCRGDVCEPMTLCQCEPGWYGIMCENLCREETTCSGAGLCSFDGLSCSCNAGVKDPVPKPAYPGPFCTIKEAAASVGGGGGGDENGDGTGNTTSTTRLTSSQVSTILTVILPAVCGVIVAAIVLYYFVTLRHRQLRDLHKTIIEFPQPQLEIPAEERPDALIMIPDESGWTNFDLPKATADFQYGPASGHLVSAVAASQRASMAHMSMSQVNRRATSMKNKMKKSNTARAALAAGPVHFASDSEGSLDADAMENGHSDGSDPTKWHVAV